MPGADNNTKNKKRDPETAPANQLVDAVIAALSAGVERSEIVSALRFARGAGGYKAPVWRAAASSLTDAAKSLNATAGPQDEQQPGYRADAMTS